MKGKEDSNASSSQVLEAQKKEPSLATIERAVVELLMLRSLRSGHPVESFGDPDYCSGVLDTLFA